MIDSLGGRPLSIALFSDSALPVRNGVSVSIDALVRRLRELGHSTHLFAPGFPGYADQDPNVHRFRSVMTPFAGGTPWAIPLLSREKRAFQAA
ncbi:MAG: glycosyltransferase, partial [Armatimonadota bacterium]